MNISLPPEDTVFRKHGEKVLEWGLDEWNIMKPKIKHFRTCLDIGAHVGLTTLRFSNYFENVHSFEPVHYSYLKENTGHLINVTIYNCAISDKEGEIEIYPGTANSGAGIIPDEYNQDIIQSRYTKKNARYKDVNKITVPTKPIDSFGFTNVDLIKIDVEGYLLPVLEGMKHTFQNNNPVIQIETAANNIVNQKMRNILTSMGYKKFHEHGKPIDEFYVREL